MIRRKEKKGGGGASNVPFIYILQGFFMLTPETEFPDGVKSMVLLERLSVWRPLEGKRCTVVLMLPHVQTFACLFF